MHSNLITGPVEDRRKACLCGALSGRPHHRCLKCVARLGWRRHTRHPRRSVARHPTDHRTCAQAWAFFSATSMLRIISKAVGS
jgi:hypothetical protein